MVSRNSLSDRDNIFNQYDMINKCTYSINLSDKSNRCTSDWHSFDKVVVRFKHLLWYNIFIMKVTKLFKSAIFKVFNVASYPSMSYRIGRIKFNNKNIFDGTR